MTKRQKLLTELEKCALSLDTEAAHGNADDALIAFINDDEIKAAYENVPKWYA